MRQRPRRDVHAAEAEPKHQRAVARVKAVDGKGRASRLAIAAAAHTVRRRDRVLQRPRNDDRKDLYRRFQAGEQFPGGNVATKTALRVRNNAELLLEPRHEAQRHAENQRQRRDQAAEQIDEFIGGHNGIVAIKPHQHRRKHCRSGKAVENALQCQWVAVWKICQNRHAIVIEGRVNDCRQQYNRQHPPKLKAQRASAAEQCRIRAGARQGHRQTHRVPKDHGKRQHHREI